MKMFKKITGILTAAAMLFCFSTNVFASDNTNVAVKETIGAYTYGLNGHREDTYLSHSNCFQEGDHYSVLYYNWSSTTPPEILTQLHGIPVTCIRGIFQKPDYTNGISNSPEIPPYLTDISYAFSQANFAVAPNIPDSVKNMSVAFGACPNLTSFPKLPSGIVLMNQAFASCPKVTGEIDLPVTIKEMDEAFMNCTKLGVIPDVSKLTKLTNAKQSFMGCANAVGGTDLPNSGLKTLSYMFSGCVKMTTPPRVIYDSVTDISGMFNQCENLSGTIDVRATLSLDKPNNYVDVFKGVASVNGAALILNYTAQNEAVIDDIISKKTIINDIKKGVMLPAELPPDGGGEGDGDATPPIVPPVTPPANSLPVVDGKSSQEVIVRGIVEPINTLDIDVPLNLEFIIDENRDIHYTKNAKVISRSPAPFEVSCKSVTVPQGVPALVADNAFADWDNLTVAQTKSNFAISINGKNLSTAGIKLGDISSGFTTEANLPLNLSVLYGKLWNNTTRLTYNYSMNLEFSLAS